MICLHSTLNCLWDDKESLVKPEKLLGKSEPFLKDIYHDK